MMIHQVVRQIPRSSKRVFQVFNNLFPEKTLKEDQTVFGNELVVLILVENWIKRWGIIC